VPLGWGGGAGGVPLARKKGPDQQSPSSPCRMSDELMLRWREAGAQSPLPLGENVYFWQSGIFLRVRVFM